MNTVGEPYSGKPNVRIDEGRPGEAVPNWAAYSTDQEKYSITTGNTIDHIHGAYLQLADRVVTVEGIQADGGLGAVQLGRDDDPLRPSLLMWVIRAQRGLPSAVKKPPRCPTAAFGRPDQAPGDLVPDHREVSLPEVPGANDIVGGPPPPWTRCAERSGTAFAGRA